MEYIKKPFGIEDRSMEIISEELGDRSFPGLTETVVKRVIHTTADFEYADLLEFFNNPVEAGIEAIKKGAPVVTDTNMIRAGLNKKLLGNLNCSVNCFMADEDVALKAKELGVTRAMVSMEKAAQENLNGIFLVGNAPTALFRISELMKEGKLKPQLIVAVPVGFVGAAESKDMAAELDVPVIITRGRKGGSTVAVSIMNAITYMVKERER